MSSRDNRDWIHFKCAHMQCTLSTLAVPLYVPLSLYRSQSLSLSASPFVLWTWVEFIEAPFKCNKHLIANVVATSARYKSMCVSVCVYSKALADNINVLVTYPVLLPRLLCLYVCLSCALLSLTVWKPACVCRYVCVCVCLFAHLCTHVCVCVPDTTWHFGLWNQMCKANEALFE